MPERLASYVVGQEKTYFVTTIDYENPSAPCFNGTESGIRDMSKHWDGRRYDSYKDYKDVIPFTLVQHGIYPLERGHKMIVDALKAGAEPSRLARSRLSDLLW